MTPSLTAGLTAIGDAVSSALEAAGLRRERLLIVGSSPLARLVIRAIEADPRGHIIAGIVEDSDIADEHGVRGYPRLGSVDRLPAIIDQVLPHRIIVALSERRGRTPLAALLECCVPRRIAVDDAAEYFEQLTGRLVIEALTPATIAFSGRFRPTCTQRACARLLTVLVAGIGLMVSLPLLAIIALAIKIDSPGPILFVQPRIGARGRPFNLLKFRSMQTAAGPHSEWVADNGTRVTRVGRWLRALRLDELPQFINMLRGEMNLVGPRPHPLSNLELFTLVGRNLNDRTGDAVSYYTLRSIVRPGLTGWAQVRYRYANNLEEEMEKLRYDLYYVKYASVWLDLRILVEQVAAVVTGRVADGLEHTPAPRPRPVPLRPFRLFGRMAPRRAA